MGQDFNLILHVNPKYILLGFNIYWIFQEFNCHVHWRKIILFGSLPRVVHYMRKIPSLTATPITNLIVFWLYCSCLIHCNFTYAVVPPYPIPWTCSKIEITNSTKYISFKLHIVGSEVMKSHATLPILPQVWTIPLFTVSMQYKSPTLWSLSSHFSDQIDCWGIAAPSFK